MACMNVLTSILYDNKFSFSPTVFPTGTPPARLAKLEEGRGWGFNYCCLTTTQEEDILCKAVRFRYFSFENTEGLLIIEYFFT